MDSKNPSGAKSRAEVYDWIQCIIFALVFCVLLFVFAVRMVNVVGHSMVPTLEQSDKVVISNLFYHPKQGDVVVLRKQTLMQEPIVKRIIATEGQTVDIDFDDGVVYVDGKALDEPYVNEPVHDRENFEGKITIRRPYRRAACSSWATTATPLPTAATRASAALIRAISWAGYTSRSFRSRTLEL